MKKQINVRKFVDKFAESVIQQTEAIRQRDPRTGNKHARQRLSAFLKLRALGDEGRDALVPLMAHPRADVRAMAACFLLRHKTELALSVLRQVAGENSGLAGFGASEAIKRWEEGTWQLDPPD